MQLKPTDMKNKEEIDDFILNVNLHYAPFLFNGNIKSEKYKGVASLYDRICEIYGSYYLKPDDCMKVCGDCTKCQNTCDYENEYVFLLTIGDEIVITEEEETLLLPLRDRDYMIARTWKNKDIHLFVFKSYEEAYRIALDMREPNPLCYEK